MRRLLKFLHTMGAIGFMGAMACLLVLIGLASGVTTPSEYALLRAAMAAIAKWVFLPSLALTLIAGLLAIGLNRAYHNAGWAWIKLATGILIFEGGLTGVQGPMQEEAERSAAVLGGPADPAIVTVGPGPESGTLWVLLAVATVNVVLGVWRPRLTRLPD
jgi:hypothetical protein